MFVPVDAQIGISPISAIDSTARHPIGTRVRFTDPTLGEGEFIYLPGVASNVVGAAVTFDLGAGTVTLAPATANMAKPLAISMQANTDPTKYSWFQISGQAAALTTGTVADGNALYLAGSGQLTATAAAGKQVLNAQASGANGGAGTNLTYVTINRPFAQGAIT